MCAELWLVISCDDWLLQQLAPAVERATSPFQFALTKSGCECVAHIAQTLTDLDGNTTLLSVDGIGAFDLISRSAMVQGLLEVEGGSAAFPFVRQFYGSASTYWWDDDEGVTHEVVQGEGGEPGDPLMPAKSALGHPSCSPQSVCCLSSTTCTCCAVLTAWPMCTFCCNKRSGSTPGFRSITGIPKSGTGQARNPELGAL